MKENINLQKLTEFEKELLFSFSERRKIFDNYISEKKLNLFTCPSCGYPTNSSIAEFDICLICDWEDDGKDDNSKSILDDFLLTNKISGPNRISLIENRIKICKELFELSKKMNGQINVNPKQVFESIKQKRKHLKQVYKSIPMTADRNHIGWIEANEVKLELLIELVSTDK